MPTLGPKVLTITYIGLFGSLGKSFLGSRPVQGPYKYDLSMRGVSWDEAASGLSGVAGHLS